MPTDAQRKANRQNAKKSTGPRTPEGKARSSKNALKHGLLARDAVMADEDPAEYDRQLQILEENLFPKNAIEFELVTQIADSRWRLRRITRIEAGLTTYQYHGTDRSTRERYPDTVVPGRNGENQLLGKSMQDHTQALHNLARYRTMTSRDITRALRMIRQLRKDEFECKENRAANGAIHRPTVTDPDPYNTPDPMEPQPPRYEPPAAAAQTSNPIGFRAESQQTEARSADLAFEIRGLSSQSTPSPQATLGGESRFTNHASRKPNQGVTQEGPRPQTNPKPRENKRLEHRRSPQDQLLKGICG